MTTIEPFERPRVSNQSLVQVTERPPLPGRDPRAVYHPPIQGLPTLNSPRHVGVVGGGIAGMSAACVLAERGVQVSLFEPQKRLGGRTSSWKLNRGRTMSRGFHAFFRQYYNLRALLKRLDPELGFMVHLDDYPLQRPDGMRESFKGLPHTPPWSMLGFFRRSPSITLGSFTRINLSAAVEVMRIRFPDAYDAYDGESAAQFLDRLQFPVAARDLALEIFARTAFADPRTFSAGELVTMFHTYFVGSAEGLIFDVPNDTYEAALWGPMREHLERLGVSINTGTFVQRVGLGQEIHLIAAGERVDVDAVVMATDPRTARRLIAEIDTGQLPTNVNASELADWQSRVAETINAPPFMVLKLWLSKPLNPDRDTFVGTSGFGSLDNVSILSNFEATAAQWAAEHGGSVIEMHAYACDPAVVNVPEASDAVIRDLEHQVRLLYPEINGMEVVDRDFVIRDDCTLIDPGGWHRRPGVETPDPRLMLAGDWVRSDYPVVLMERAATTGMLAANALLTQWGVTGQGLWTVPMHGVLRRSNKGRSPR